ncbi:hypothetical protein RHECNPAF_1360021 [Rhizobium etli CNPAF512]|nr:hypothetical protein RHECNPAF_1360021 [Rhizobium etli CNPAF512]
MKGSDCCPSYFWFTPGPGPWPVAGR